MASERSFLHSMIGVSVDSSVEQLAALVMVSVGFFNFVHFVDFDVEETVAAVEGTVVVFALDTPCWYSCI